KGNHLSSRDGIEHRINGNPSILMISITGFQTTWLTKGKKSRFSPLWSEAPRTPGRGILAKESNGPQLHGGNLIGNVPAASRGIAQ
ncbi:MAG: hypothetical protein ACE10H_09815, partial [Candidatus Binatia bacterium]